MSASEEDFAAAVERFVAQLRSAAAVGAREFAARHPELGSELLAALEAAEDLEVLRVVDGPPLSTALERLGTFRIERELGRGGMGVVYAAFDESLGRSVALKLLPRSLLSSVEARARFRREATLAARLDHPGICTVYGAGVTDDQAWIAMRLVEGRSLAAAIAAARAARASTAALGAPSRDGGARSVAQCIERVARALAVAHSAGVIHRDIKPSNVIVTRDGAPVLVDFGVAFESDSDAPGLTRTGEFAGTPAYLAPELIAGERARADERCDVYALGVTLYECLTLRQPFAAPTRDSLYRAVLGGQSRDVRSLNGAVPRELAVVVATAMERDPRRRYASAEAFADDLAAFLNGRDIAARAAGPIERVVRWARREPRQAALAAALAVVAVAGSAAAGMWLSAQKDARVGRQAQQAREIEAALVEAYTALSSSSLVATARFESVLALDPHNAEASVGLILACLRARRDDQARALLRDAPSSPAFDRLRAIADHTVSRSQDADWLERASAFELFVDAEAFRLEGERRPRSEQARWWRSALERIDEAIVRAPQPRATYHHMRVFCASKLGDADAARSASQTLAALWPDSAVSLYHAGSALTAFDPPKAIEMLTRSAELDGSRAATFQCLGMARLQLGEFELALASLERALALNPLDVLAYNGIGATYLRLKCDDQARGALYAALSIDPWSIDAWANLTLAASDFGETLAAAEHVLDLDPGQAGHRAMYGAALLNLGEAARARDEFARLIVADGENPMYWYTYSGALAQSGELQTAWDALQLAKGLKADLPGVGLFEEQLRTALHSGE